MSQSYSNENFTFPPITLIAYDFPRDRNAQCIPQHESLMHYPSEYFIIERVDQATRKLQKQIWPRLWLLFVSQ